MQDISGRSSTMLQDILTGMVARHDPAHDETVARLNKLVEEQDALDAQNQASTAPLIAIQILAEGDVLRFRENFRTRCVELQLNKEVIFSSSEYRTTAVYAQQQYGLSEDTLYAMYDDYKEDYDNPGRSDNSTPSMG